MFDEKKNNAVETPWRVTLGLLELQGGGIMRHAGGAVIAVKCEVPVANFNIRERESKSEERSRTHN